MVNYYVSPTGNNANDGLSTSAPKQTIDAAHTAASNGDTIILMDGTHSYSANLTLTKNVSLTSLNGAASTVLSFSVADSSITFQDVSGVTISNITFDDINTFLAVLNITFPSSGATKPTVWPTNVTVRGCVFNTSKYAIATKGENISIYNNTINRKSGVTASISAILVYFVRGYLFIDGNTWTDNINPSRFVYFSSVGTSPSPYLQFVNSRDGNVIITNNQVNMNTEGTVSESTNRTMVFVIQDSWNIADTAPPPGGQPGLTSSEVSTFRLVWSVTGNIINANSIGGTIAERLRTRCVIADMTGLTNGNDSNGNNAILQWSSAYFTNNTFNCTGTAGNNESILALNAGTMTITDYATPRFYFTDNIITQPVDVGGVYPINTNYSGDRNFAQRITISPTGLNLEPWIPTSFPPPSYPITDNLLLLPNNIDLTLVGTYESYAGKAGEPEGTTSVTIPFTNAAASQVVVSNLDTNVFKVVIGVSPSVESNSFWFFIRVYDINGVQVTSFSSPITVQITSSMIQGSTLTVQLNGTTFTTTATEVSTDVYEFSLSSNSEYLLTGQLQNSFMLSIPGGFLALDTAFVYTNQTVVALENGRSVPTSARVVWAPDGLASGTICRDMGVSKTITSNNLHVYKFQKVQLIQGPISEGVRESADNNYSTGWICTWAASGVAPLYD